MPEIDSTFFLDQLTLKRNGPGPPHLRSEHVEDAGFWDKRGGCGLNRWLGSTPSSWLPAESIVPTAAAFLFPLRQLEQTHLQSRRNRARLCAHCLILSRPWAVLAWALFFAFPEVGLCLLALTASGGNGFLCSDNVLSNRPVDSLPALFIHQASAWKKGYFEKCPLIWKLVSSQQDLIHVECIVGRADQMQVSQQPALLQRTFSLVIQLVSTSSRICPGWRPCFCFPQPLLFNLSRLFCCNFFFLFVTLFPQNSLYWTELWPNNSFDSFFVIRTHPLPLSPLS